MALLDREALERAFPFPMQINKREAIIISGTTPSKNSKKGWFRFRKSFQHTQNLCIHNIHGNPMSNKEDSVLVRLFLVRKDTLGLEVG